MSRRFRRGLIVSLAAVIVSILATEVFLRSVDPLGAYAYSVDMYTLRLHGRPHDTRGYVIPPVEIQLTNSLVYVTEEGRAVPDTNRDVDCLIVALGDSVTFGMGVNDADTWVNQIARQHREAHFVNTAFNGYNSANIRAVVEAVPADGYVYLMIENDDEYPEVWRAWWETDQRPTGWLSYTFSAITSQMDSPPVWPGFEEDMRVILGRSDVLAFTIEEYPLTVWAREHYPEVIPIPIWTSTNSQADGHPDPDGHKEIADHMAPHVGEWIEEICNR